jgi:glutaredoxin
MNPSLRFRIKAIRMEQAIGAESRRLLEAFDAPGRDASHGGTLHLAEMGSAGEIERWCATAEELVARGWLRRAGEPDAYIRTEDGRLAVARTLEVTLYTRPGCHLCDEAKALIAPLLAKAGGRLREVNIDGNEELRERYNADVPVIFMGARKVAKHRVDLDQFRRQLAEAERKSPRG